MRLLNVHTLEFSVYHSTPPPYAIASHRWHLGHEASYKDILKKRNTTSTGYKKVLEFADFVRKNVGNVEWLWIDTCCILQQSSEEVSEAVNSMFKWYRNAVVCIAWLDDFGGVREGGGDLGMLGRSRWFTRGWTLQELVAPKTVVFVTRGWEVLGYKGIRTEGLKQMAMGPELGEILAGVTGIPEPVLKDYEYARAIGAEQKLEWMSERETTREEDQSYCLLGFFDVTMPVIYGEGREKARMRLLAEIKRLNVVPANLDDDFEVVEKPAIRTLHEAASSGDLEFISQYLEGPPSRREQLWTWDAGGGLPLHRAVRNDQALTCKLLIASMNGRTWDPVDLLDMNGKSPVEYALYDVGSESDDVLREFLTDEGLCFALPTILTVRKTVLVRILELGGPDVILRAIRISRKAQRPALFSNLLQRTLATVVTVPQSERLVPSLAADVIGLANANEKTLTAAVAKMTDMIYNWAVSERVKRLILLQKVTGLEVFTGSDGLNFVGKAILANDTATLSALHKIDLSLFSRPVGWWTGDHLTVQVHVGEWHPLRFAAFLGYPQAVELVARLTDPEENDPPHLRAVHYAAIYAYMDDKRKSTFRILRELSLEDDDSEESTYCIVNFVVTCDTDWFVLVFPHSREAVIEDIKTASPEKFYWDAGHVRTRKGQFHTRTCDKFNMRVRTKCIDRGSPDSQQSAVNLSFMHGWNNSEVQGEKGRVILALAPESEADVWFRESNQHHFSQMDDNATVLASGTNWRESAHNHRAWQLRCEQKVISSV
ncbi:Vegetative incompatibility protein HET-E-1 [Cercospora beticola]|uniref:Vegetative incompatibility protein HET-E-1 n=1 Tax=Cercospora beticola TaxID=122368 RepID=A0A2G5I3J5_CERBT|nr:Vegetative incompatibility protein HET-E-1 [Cercospora beticola]PIA99385.1 Vegetative incompatibility protein HET-E-1 [Cercospora beticola]WPA99485.1 hypothetical protein RHO25_004103 [Cercospora beticola]